MSTIIEHVVPRVQAEQPWLNIRDDCFIRDASVCRQDHFAGEEDDVYHYLCDHCSKKRKVPTVEHVRRKHGTQLDSLKTHSMESISID